MISRLLKLWDTLSGSYWLVPTLMALSSIVAALYFTQNQWVLESTLLEDSPWLYKSTPEAAREVLSTIAGSMITVASVTFSITIASVAYAASQFGPRLLTNFMYDRGNQITLGTFISTFIYSLMVLRTLTGSDADGGFVPQLAVTVGVLLGVASIGVLIYFVHHVPASIHAANVIGDIGKQLMEKVDALYPPAQDKARAGEPQLEPEDPADSPIDLGQAFAVLADFDGFVQFIDNAAIIEIAQALDTVIVLDVRPGEFVNKGRFLGWILDKNAVEKEHLDAIRGAVLHGMRRTAAQDVMFLSRELIEIAARALSPGVNDPFTAMECMDWLGSAMVSMATRTADSGRQCSDQDTLRLITNPVTQIHFIQQNLSMTRVYAATDRNAALHFQALLGRILLVEITAEIRQLILNQSEQLQESAQPNFSKRDQQELFGRHETLQLIGNDKAANGALVHRCSWLGGSI